MTSKEDLLRSFADYIDQVGRGFDAVRDALEQNDFDRAARIMTAISINQASMSVRLNASCIKIKEGR